MKEMAVPDPYDQGFQSNTDGKPETDNPHPEGTVEHEAWKDGHAAAQAIHEEWEDLIDGVGSTG